LTESGRRPNAVVYTHSHWDHVFGGVEIDGPVIAHTLTAEKLVEMAARDWTDDASVGEHIREELPAPRVVEVRPADILFDVPSASAYDDGALAEAMAKAGAKLVSHVNTELWMTQEIIHDWEKKTFPPRAKEALPTDTFYGSMRKMTFAGEPIEFGLMPVAHTDGDIYVHFTQSNVLVAGDAVQPGRLPMLDWPTGGWIGGMQEAQRTLLRVANDTTKIVPANGPVMTKADLQMSLDLVTQVREHLVKLVKQGMGPQDLIAAKAMKDFQGKLAGDPDPFLYTAYRGIYAHARELGGVL